MLFGLTCDFIQRDGICMVLDEPGGLSADKLNKVQTRMMVNTRIPNHLRLHLKEIDLKVTLEYAVSGKKMLAHLLKSEKLTMDAFFGLLLQMAQGMEEGRLYMLDPGMYALHEDYIFIEGSLQNGKVYLTYIPLVNPTVTNKPGENLRSLIMVLMASIAELSGNGVQRLLQYCGEAGFSTGGLKGLLAELLTEGNDSLRNSRIIADERVVKVPAPPVIEQAVPERFAHEKARVRPWIASHPEEQLLENKRQVSNFNLSVQEDSNVTTASGSKTYIMLGCLLGDALLWKFFYLHNPSSLALIACGVVTIVLAVVCGMAWKGIFRLGSRVKDKAEEAEIRAVMTGESEGGVHSFGRTSLPLHRSVPVVTAESVLDPSVPSRSHVRLANFMAQADASDKPQVAMASEQTVIPNPSPVPIAPTTLLSREKKPVSEQGDGKPRREAPYLERYVEEGDGLKEKIELNRPSFIIGRSAEVAQYIESSEGASRVHAEISRSTSGYILKDLDSRNGTFFQGEPMIPYKEYQLAEGDVFTIVKGNYTFRSA